MQKIVWHRIAQQAQLKDRLTSNSTRSKTQTSSGSTTFFFDTNDKRSHCLRQPIGFLFSLSLSLSLSLVSSSSKAAALFSCNSFYAFDKQIPVNQFKPPPNIQFIDLCKDIETFAVTIGALCCFSLSVRLFDSTSKSTN
jgi:hypothetical protein